jgi:hypothetical protein
MKDTDPPPPGSADPAPFDAFKELASKLARVPKEEAEYQREQAKKPKRGPKPT